jgi:hypothetical protein
MKYEYRFEIIELKRGIMSLKPEQDYHNIITQVAQDGWRLVQIFAPGTSGYGSASFFELIFERPID